LYSTSDASAASDWGTTDIAPISLRRPDSPTPELARSNLLQFGVALARRVHRLWRHDSENHRPKRSLAS
jgi:hypothetical protein